MMHYKGIYWDLFAPLIKKSIAARYSKELAKRSVKNGKAEYRGLLKRADDLGPGNPMAMNAYFAYVFAAAWLGGEKSIPPDGMAEVMGDVLHKMRPFFAMTDLNSKRGEKKWYRDMKKYEAWSKDKLEKYPTTWVVGFDENLHRDGSYYYFTRCPICEFCKREGISEIMPPLCGTDRLMFEMQHGTLHRKHTIAGGDPVCDYWVTGDKMKKPR